VWSSRPRRFTPGRVTRYPLYRQSGPQGRSGRVWKISSPTRFNPRPLWLLSFPIAWDTITIQARWLAALPEIRTIHFMKRCEPWHDRSTRCIKSQGRGQHCLEGRCCCREMNPFWKQISSRNVFVLVNSVGVLEINARVPWRGHLDSVYSFEEIVVGKLIICETNTYSYLQHHRTRSYIQRLVQMC
jgi:hypothetical protein